MRAVKGSLHFAAAKRVSKKIKCLIVNDAVQTVKIKLVVIHHALKRFINAAAPSFKLIIQLLHPLFLRHRNCNC